MKKLVSLIIVSVIVVSVLAEETMKIGVIEHLEEVLPDDIYLVDIYGDTVRMSGLIDKPTVLNFVYYRCPGICTPLMDGLTEVVNVSEMTLGVDYQILTVSFDYTEGHDLALKKRNNYSMLVEKEGMEKGWLFFTGDSLNITKLTNAAGFCYKKMGN